MAKLSISLENEIPPPLCVYCSGHANVSPRKQFELGTVAWLPRQEIVSQDSCAHQQLGSGAFNHPCVIIAHSSCKHLAFCLQGTSFQGQTLQQKYRFARNARRQLDSHLALRRRDTIPHNGLGELDHSGEDMDKQTYVNLEYGFWVEQANLGTHGRRCLKPESIDRAIKLYHAAEIHRRQFGSDSDKRLRTRSPPTTVTPSTIPWRSPVFTPYVMPSSAPIEASPFILPPRTNKAVRITAPPSLDKQVRMQGSWRPTGVV